MHELGDSRHTQSMYCGRYIRITSENTQVYLSKTGLVTTDVFSEGLHRLKCDQVLQTPVSRLVEWRKNVWNGSASVNLQTKMP